MAKRISMTAQLEIEWGDDGSTTERLTLVVERRVSPSSAPATLRPPARALPAEVIYLPAPARVAS